MKTGPSVRVWRVGGVCVVAIACLLVFLRSGSGEETGPPDQAVDEPSAAHADDAPSAGELGRTWVRLLRDKDGQPLAMQTAVVQYVPEDGNDSGEGQPVAVDLIGAIHVGDRAYYEKLNKRFEQYEALLFELVAPEGTVVERGRGTSNGHPVGAIQNGLKSFLDLEHQLELIDYTRENFVHADMSPEQFAKSMDDRGESFLQMYFRLLGQELARQSQQKAQGQSADMELFAAFFSKDRHRKLKIALAKQFEGMEGMLASFGGPEGSTIITERNRVALDVLSKQIESGKRKLGVFYGAGHLADMDERLRKDFGLKPVKVTWLDAWNLRP